MAKRRWGGEVDTSVAIPPSCPTCCTAPTLSSAEYEALYNGGDCGFQGSWLTRDHVLARRVLCLRSPRTILYVGPGGGAFLASLSDPIQGDGLDLSRLARSACVSRGIGMIEADDGRQFDAVTAFNVIEHVTEPACFMEGLSARARRTIILSTCDPEAAAWARHGSAYWYSAFSEHITFPSSRAIRDMAKRLGFSIEQEVYFRTTTNPLRIAVCRLFQGSFHYRSRIHKAFYRVMPGRDWRLPATCGYLDQRLYVLGRDAAG